MNTTSLVAQLLYGLFHINLYSFDLFSAFTISRHLFRRFTAYRLLLAAYRFSICSRPKRYHHLILTAPRRAESTHFRDDAIKQNTISCTNCNWIKNQKFIEWLPILFSFPSYDISVTKYLVPKTSIPGQSRNPTRLAASLFLVDGSKVTKSYERSEFFFM